MKQTDPETVLDFLCDPEADAIFGSELKRQAGIVAYAIAGKGSLPSILRGLRAVKKSDGLAEVLKSPSADAYFGKTFRLRADVLAWLITGEGSLASIAAKHGISKQAMTKHAKRAKDIFGATGG